MRIPPLVLSYSKALQLNIPHVNGKKKMLTGTPLLEMFYREILMAGCQIKMILYSVAYIFMYYNKLFINM